MKMPIASFIPFLAVALANACSEESSFKGGTSRREAETVTQVGQDPATAVAPGTKTDVTQVTDADNGTIDPSNTPVTCTNEGGTIVFQFPKKIQDCSDAGDIYSFENPGCSGIEPLSGDCNWDNAIKAFADLGATGLVPNMTEDKNNGARIMACGQKRSGDTAVVQYFEMPNVKNGDCSVSSSVVVHTVCYEISSSPNPSDGKSKEEAVENCLNPALVFP